MRPYVMVHSVVSSLFLANILNYILDQILMYFWSILGTEVRDEMWPLTFWDFLMATQLVMVHIVVFQPFL